VAILFAPLLRPRKASQVGAAGRGASDLGLTSKEMLCTSTFWLYNIWIVSCMAGGLMVIGHIVPFAREAGVVPSLAALSMGIFSAANALGRPIAGTLLDKFGQRASMFTAPLVMMIGLAILGWGTKAFGLPGLLIGAVIVALSFGGIFALNAPLLLKFFGPKHFAANLGIQGFSMFIGGFFGPQIAGLVKARTGSYTMSFVVGIVLLVVGLIFGQMVLDTRKSR